jgi:uncharacterized protein (DUF885 family)
MRDKVSPWPRGWLGALAVLAMLWLPASAMAAAEGAATATAEERFRAIHESEWPWRVREIGIEDDDDEARRIHAEFRDVSAPAQMARQAYLEKVMAQLEGIDPGSLAESTRIDYAVYRAQIEALLARYRYRDYEMPLNSSGGFWSHAAGHARKPYRTEADYRAYLSLLRGLPRYFEQNIANMRSGLQRGFTQPRTVLAGRDAPIAAIADAKPEGTPYYKPFVDMPGAIPAQVQAELRRQARAAIGEAVIPAYRALRDFLRDSYVPGARTSLAAYDLPEGAAYYRSRIREYVTLDLAPEAIHEIGLREVARIRGEMEQAKRASGFDGDLQGFLEFLRTDPQFYPASEKELLKEAAWIANRFDSIAPNWFGRMPRMRFGIRPMPAETAPFSSYAVGGPGYYLLNTYDLISRPLYVLTALTLHEAAPGHAFQMPLAAENSAQPIFRQKVYMSAYGEGWALYCEKLGVEMGMYETPYDLFGMLNYQAWRAARLVVDTGIHAKGWDRARAIAYMQQNTSLNQREIETEVDRYIAVPAQALSYYLGMLAIERERAKAQLALGDRFDIRAFHDAVLEAGSVPLPALEKHVDDYLAKTRRQ